MMNEELLSANALLVQVASYWSVSISSWRKVCKLQLSNVKPTQVSNSGTSKGIGIGGAVYRHWWRSVPALVAQCVKGLLPR
jgi:hypothetical protein